MSLDTLESLLLEQLQDIYYTESRLVQAMPWIARAASEPSLRASLLGQNAQARAHVTRMEQIFGLLHVPAQTGRSPSFDELLHEAGKMMQEEYEPLVRDAGLIACAQRIAHYQISAYGNLRVLADASNLGAVMGVIEESLDEERAADRALVEIADYAVLPALWPPEAMERVQPTADRYDEMDVVDLDDVEWQ